MIFEKIIFKILNKIFGNSKLFQILLKKHIERRFKRVTQRERIKRELIENPFGITSWECFRDYGITRLSAIIYDLRHKDGMNIISIPETRLNRYGEKTTFDRYRLKPEEKQMELF